MKRRRPGLRGKRRASPGQAIAGFFITLGLGALAVSLVAPTSSSPEQTADVLAVYETVHDDFDPETGDPVDVLAVQSSRVQRAAPIPEGRLPVEERRPPQQQAVPAYAPPASQARSLGAGPITSSGSSASSAPARAPSVNNQPLSVVIVAAEPSTQEVASSLVDRLKLRGVSARVSDLEDAGRPDALLMLARRGGPSSEAWFCDPGPATSSRLAGALLSASDITDGIDEAAAPQHALACDELHAGRARVPSVLLELARPDDVNKTADGLAAALGRYLSDDLAAIKAARAAPKLVWPASGSLTSRYGPGHPLGIDIAMWQGDILAATDGTVIFAGGDPCCAYGRYVVIDSPDGLRTLYAHLEELDVRKGQKVRAGQSLGSVGCTGRCTGPHLHFELIDAGKRQNPLRYLP